MAIQLLNNGLHIENGQFQFAWYEVVENHRHYFRAAVLRELASITMLEIEDADILGKQWAAMRGLYNAGVDFLYSACGIYTPEHIGIVQLYGAAANGDTVQTAAQAAQDRMRAVEGTLANFPQSRTRVPDLEIMRWYMDFLTARGQRMLAVLGYPDPRVKRRSTRQDGALPDESIDDLSLEQNEVLFRGLTKLRENFVFQVTSKHIDRRELIANLIRIAQVTSNIASRQKGAKSIGFSMGVPIMTSLANAYSGGQSVGDSTSHSQADGASQGWGTSHTNSQSHTESQSSSVSVSESWGTSAGSSASVGHTDSIGQTSSTSHTESQSVSDGTSTGTSYGSGESLTHMGSMTQGVGLNAGVDLILTKVGVNNSTSVTQGASLSEGWSSSASSGSSHTETSGSADTIGSAVSTGSADSYSSGTSEGSSHSVGITRTSTSGVSDTVGTADSKSQSWGQSHAEGSSWGNSAARTGGQAVGSGFSTGFAPSVSLGQSWQTEDDVAMRTTEILRGLEAVVNQASAEGGFMTDVLLFTENDGGRTAAASLVPQAFHGPGLPTPVFTVLPAGEDQLQLRSHALAFLPCSIPDPSDPFGGMLGTRYSTLLTAGQLAAYTAPAILQEGTTRIVAPIPEGMGFYPRMVGEVVLGHQFSPTTRDLTPTQVRLNKGRLMHTMFAGNTGFGKSVAAMRMVYEMALHWGMRIVVLDFGFAWRMLLNAPGLQGRVDIRQLRPDGVRPLRWNPLQIGTYINPETQLKAFADMFGTVAQLGQKQQQHRLLDGLRSVYIKAGVLVDDPEVRRDAGWGKVNPDEEPITGAPSGTPLGSLTPDQRQQLTVYRSSKVGLVNLYEEIVAEQKAIHNPKDIGYQVLEGILWRLKSLVRGAAAAQFAPSEPGNPTSPVEDLGRPNGVVVLEGGKFLDNFAKAWLLGWAGWLIYSDMVVRRERQLNTGEADLFMVYEEANIIFSGLDGGDPEASSGPSVSEQQSNMFRDSRKYGAFFGVVTQSPSLIPKGIASSCNNIVVGYLSDPKDKDIVLASLARSEKGFRDEPWRRFLTDMQIGMVIGKFPYLMDRDQQLPFLFQPLILNVPEPTDAEIEQRLGRITL